jgi:hypothetical protein
MLKEKSIAHFKLHWTFYALLVLGIAVRLFMMSGSGLSNDELSAWYRTGFSSWADFWYYGVQHGDMHPVFYQALLWFWVRIGGDSDFWFRVPSLLFFIANLTLVYQIGKNYFSKSSALLIIACYVGLSFFIINTTTSRPYNSGVFFVLLLLLFLLKGLKKNVEFSWRSILGIVVSLIGAMLSHYFAFLSAGIICVVALFFLPKKNRLKLLIAGVLSLAFFSLHWSVTWYQLNRGGLGWLPPPNWNWLWEFWVLFFQDSVLLGALCLMAILMLGSKFSNWTKERKFFLIAFIAIAIVAYFLSIFFTPILREAVMQFFFPMMFFAFVGDLKKSPFQKWGLVSFGIGTMFLLSSIIVYPPNEPIHYGVFKEIGEARESISKRIPTVDIMDLVNVNHDSYLEKYTSIDFKENLGDLEDDEMQNTVFERSFQSNNNFAFYAWSNNYHTPMLVETMHRKFPAIIEAGHYRQSAYYLMSKNEDAEAVTTKENRAVFRDQLGVDSAEFFANHSMKVSELRTKKSGYWVIEGEFSRELNEELIFVVVVNRNGEMLKRNDQPVYYVAHDQKQLSNLNGLGFIAFELNDHLKDDDELLFYCWNPSKSDVHLGKLKKYFLAF